MTAPRPEVVDRAVELAVAELRRAAVDYRVAHDASHDQRRGGRQGSGGGDRNDIARLVAATRPQREKLEEIAKAILRSCSFASRAGTAYGEWCDLIDDGMSRELVDPAVVKSLGSWKENHAQGEQARLRRAARGAVLPGSDYGLKVS